MSLRPHFSLRTAAVAAVALQSILDPAISTALAGVHVWSGAVNARWSVPGNWASGGVPASGESGLVLRFPASGVNRELTNDLAQLAVHSIEFTGNGYHLHGNSVQLVPTAAGTNVSVASGLHGAVHLPLVLPTGTHRVAPGLSGSIEFASSISGTGVLQKLDRGTVRFTGPAGNTFTGGLDVLGGSVELAKSSGLAVAGPLRIGVTNSTGEITVTYLAGNQLADTADVQVLGGKGTLDLNGFSDTVNSLELVDGRVSTSNPLQNLPGVLRINGSLTAREAVNGDGHEPSIFGSLDLGNVMHTLEVPAGDRLLVHASVTSSGNNGGLMLKGGGSLYLYSSNSFAGPLQIQHGSVDGSDDHAFGSPAGPTILAGTNCRVSVGFGMTVLAETLLVQHDGTLEVAGTNAWNGSVQIASGAKLKIAGSHFGGSDWLTLGGPVSGDGDLHLYSDRVDLTGSASNTLSGQVTVLGRTALHLAKTNATALAGNVLLQFDAKTNARIHWLRSHQVGDMVRIRFDETLYTGDPAGALYLNGHSETIGALEGHRYNHIHCGSGQLTVGAGNQNSDFSGLIQGQAGTTNLIKIGTGTFSLGLTQALAGTTLVSGGTLILANATGVGPVHVASGGHLSGFNSQLGALTVSGTGRIEPGDGIGDIQYGTLMPASFNLGSGVYRCGLGSTWNGVKRADKIVTAGPLFLTGIQLQLSSLGITSGTNSYTIIEVANSGLVLGTFANLADGATFTSDEGHKFRINYHGGTGNDVVVTRLDPAPPPATLTGISPVAPGQFKLTATGQPGQFYVVVASSTVDWPYWSVIGSATADSYGKVEFIDTEAADFRARFYRFVTP